MSDVRQRRKPTAANGLPAGVGADGKPAEDSAPSTKIVKIDCHKGHVGVSCSNNLDPCGVLLDFCDPADLAAKAGMRQGDVVLKVNGVSVAHHETFIEAIASATQAEKDSASRVIEVEYLPAASVAAAAAAALAQRPPAKSLVVAYGLWAIAPPLGLHHFYLGRDAHAVLHVLTFGLLGLGWVRDFFCLPRYLSICNEDAEYVGLLKATMIARPTHPQRGFTRLLAMLVLGWYFGFVASCVPPPPGEAPWPPVASMLVETVLQCIGASLAVYLVGICPSTDGSLSATLKSSLLGACLARFLFGGEYALWASMGAIRGFGASRTYAVPGASVQRRVRLSGRRRMALVVAAAGVGYSAVGIGLYQRGGVTARTADGGMQSIRFKDAVHHVLRSPFVRNMPSILYTFATEGWSGVGWGDAFKTVMDSFDLAGEGHACETLGLGKGCLENYSDVKRAYRALALEYHPDKHAGASDEKREEVELRFREIQQAYEHLQGLHAQQKKREDAEEEAAAAAPEGRRPRRPTRGANGAS